MAKNVLANYAEVLVTVTYEAHVEETVWVKALSATKACWDLAASIRQKNHGD